MLLFLVLKNLQGELVEDLGKFLVKILGMQDQLLTLLIPHQQGSLDQEITVLDLMINTKFLLANYASPF